MNAQTPHQLHIFEDKSIEYFAVISLRDDGRGPAIGGCRYLQYDSQNDAIEDASRLSQIMSRKAATSDLPHDGGKAVIMMPNNNKNKPLVLERFAKSVDSLKGKYITTVDSGTTPLDMSFIRQFTPHVVGDREDEIENGGASNATAHGVFEGIRAAIKLKLNTTSLNGLRVAIQGVGSVGYRLAALLHSARADLIVCDMNSTLASRAAKEFNAKVVSPGDIFDEKCDIFSPCALGKIINRETISRFKTPIIAGCANDQLLDEGLAKELALNNILYIPDFVINAGGLIYLALRLQSRDNSSIIATIKEKITEKIFSLAEKSARENKILHEVALATAQEIKISGISCHGMA